MTRSRWGAITTFVVVACAPVAAHGATPVISRYDHVFLVIEENHGFSQIIGNSEAPHINALATTYGLATKFFAEASPSASNYVAMVGGDFFGISDDNPYYTHTLDKPSLMSQLDADSALIVHWDGTAWSVVASPSDNALSTNLFAVTGFAGSSNTWAVGDDHTNLTGSRGLVEEERHVAEWKVAPAPSVGVGDNHLYGIAFARATTGWAVGSELDPDGNMETVAPTGGPGGWSRVPSPGPGIATGDSVFGGVMVAGNTVWAVGAYDGVNALQTLIERCQ